MPIENITPDAFTLLLRVFNKLVANMPPVEQIKAELLKLKQSAIDSTELNSRQTDAIVARVDNYISGVYGNTKTAENLGHEKQEKTIPASNGKVK